MNFSSPAALVDSTESNALNAGTVLRVSGLDVSGSLLYMFDEWNRIVIFLETFRISAAYFEYAVFTTHAGQRLNRISFCCTKTLMTDCDLN